VEILKTFGPGFIAPQHYHPFFHVFFFFLTSADQKSLFSLYIGRSPVVGAGGEK
jgi:hypothetical protein